MERGEFWGREQGLVIMLEEMDLNINKKGIQSSILQPFLPLSFLEHKPAIYLLWVQGDP